MWDILYSQVGYVHGEGLQNGTESQVGKDQMGGESEKGERGERRDGGEMEGEEQNEKSGQGVQSSQQKNLEKQKAPFAGLVFVQHDDTTGPIPRGGWHSCSTGLPVPVRLLSTDRRPVPARGLLLHLWAQEQAPAGGPLPLCRGWGDMLCGRPRQRPGQVGAAAAAAGSIPRGLQGEGDVLDAKFILGKR